MSDSTEHNGFERNSVKDPKVAGLEVRDASDREDPQLEEPEVYAGSEVTKVSPVTPGLEETDKRGETAFHIIVSKELRIGRQGDGKVSRRHARICRSGDDFIIEDNGSSNGTMVNGRRIEFPTLIRPGDTIIIGSHRFTFVLREQY